MTETSSFAQLSIRAAVFMLLAAICVSGVDSLENASDGRLSAELEESRELSEHDDHEQDCGVIHDPVPLSEDDCFQECLCAQHPTPLLSHSWRWCSRGPPTV